jgi:hypothetical protein
MSYPGPNQWYHSQVDLIWRDNTFNLSACITPSLWTALFQQALEELAQAQNAANKAHAAAAAALANVHKVMISFVLTNLNRFGR